MDPVPCKPNSIDPAVRGMCRPVSLGPGESGAGGAGEGARRARLLAKALAETWRGGRWSHLFSVGYNLPYVPGSPVV